MYIMRLDDASQHMDLNKWLKMEILLDKYNIKPIYGIIPVNKDPELLKYEKVEDFWELMNRWKEKKWVPAMHGYTHVFETSEGGINPVNNRSEYAGVSLLRQREKIRKGYSVLKDNGIIPKIFFAPAHTFDANTLEALKKESNIRIISDTIANDIYFHNDFFFIPQQSGRCRKLPFKVTTFCYHPNIMSEVDFINLEIFLKKYCNLFKSVDDLQMKKRKMSLIDYMLKEFYFIRRK